MLGNVLCRCTRRLSLLSLSFPTDSVLGTYFPCRCTRACVCYPRISCSATEHVKVHVHVHVHVPECVRG